MNFAPTSGLGRFLPRDLPSQNNYQCHRKSDYKTSSSQFACDFPSSSVRHPATGMMDSIGVVRSPVVFESTGEM